VILPEGVIKALVPEGEPEDLPGFIYEISSGIEEELLRRSFLWTNAIALALNTSGLWRVARRIQHVSFGFVAISQELVPKVQDLYATDGSFVFGVFVLVPFSVTDGIQLLEQPVPVLDRQFPVVITSGEIELHGNPPHPHGGTGTCWVQNRGSSSNWTHGILTCRHVVENYDIGDDVQLDPSSHHSSPSEGNLADIDICTIDAAVLAIDAADWPSGLSSLSVPISVAAGSQFRFEGAQSGSVTGKVLRVHQDRKYTGNLFGQRLVLDTAAAPGDSGALVVDNVSNDGTGIYMGDIPDGRGGKDGICQDMYQAMDYFEFDLYA
jgi:hypothetical protein